MTFEQLQQRFARQDWPQLLDCQPHVAAAEQCYTMTLHVDSSLPWFTGHFPQQPVLPGVVQTHWAAQLAQTLFKPGYFQTIVNLKFKQMILPDTRLQLELRHTPEKARVAFVYQSSSTIHTSGALHFVPETASVE